MQGSVPLPRIGHSITKLDRTFVMFGGLELEKERIGPSSASFVLKLSEKMGQW